MSNKTETRDEHPTTLECPSRPLTTAEEQLIGDDVRLSYPTMSNTEAMDYLCDVVSLTPEIGAAMFVDDGTDVSAAIHTLLHARPTARARRDPANEQSAT